MGLVGLVLGILLCVTGLAVLVGNIVYMLPIVRTTRERPNAVTFTDLWLNTQVFAKRDKLRSIAQNDRDEALRMRARNALRYEVMFYVIFVSGMIVALTSAALFGHR